MRDLLVFAEQNVIEDPPFSRVDLISCRNLLIYMGAELQKKLVPLFHYALNQDGYLFLGNAESVGEFGDLFATVDRKWKIYQCNGTVTLRQAPDDLPALVRGLEGMRRPPGAEAEGERKPEAREVVQQALRLILLAMEEVRRPVAGAGRENPGRRSGSSGRGRAR